MKNFFNTFLLFLFAFVVTVQVNGQIVCNGNVNWSLGPWGSEVLTADGLLEDDGGFTDFTVSPSEITCEDVGQTIEVTVTENSTGISCTSDVLVEDKLPPVVVVDQNIYISLDATGNAIIYPEIVDEGSYDNCSDQLTYSLSQSSFDCTDVGQSIDVWLTVTDASGNYNSAFSTFMVEDKLAPVPYVFNNITITVPDDCMTTLEPSDLDAGSFDNCSDNLTFDLSKSSFDCNDIGQTFEVTFTVTDASGNSDYAVTSVYVQGEITNPDCEGVALACNYPVNVVLDDNQSITLYPYDILEGTYPGCDLSLFELSIEDSSGNVTEGTGSVVVNEAGEYTITVTSPVDNSCWTTLIVQGADECQDITVSWPGNIMVNDLSLSFQDVNTGAVRPDSLQQNYGFSVEQTLPTWEPDCQVGYNYEDQTFNLGNGVYKVIRKFTVVNWEVYDPNTQDGLYISYQTIKINGSNTNCELSDVTQPLDLINLVSIDVNDSYTPENLINNYGFEEVEVSPTWPIECDNIAMAYSDVVINSGANLKKIIRTFTVLDWFTGSFSEFVQVIKITDGQYICDFLPNSAPFGDCISGHTMDDDVEWPDDLSVSDHRISPQELVNFSNVDPNDAEPILVNNASIYTVEYIDILEGISSTEVEIKREWTISITNGGGSWTYDQMIVIDITDFDNLVSVTTHTSRAMPNVNINGSYMTNDLGVAYVDGSVESVEYNDSPSNGVDMLDYILMQQHILGIIKLESEYELFAADINGNNIVSAIDLVYLRKHLLNITPFADNTWEFFEAEPMFGEPKGAYVGAKLGDVNDSALLGQEELDNLDINYEDQLLNQGEYYDIPLYFSNDITILGSHIVVDFDPSKMSVIGVEGLDAGYLDVHITEDQIHMVNSFDYAEQIDGNNNPDFATTYLTLKIKSNANTLINESLSLNESSTLVDSSLELLSLNGEVANVISDVHDIDGIGLVKVYPNPATHYVTIDIPSGADVRQTSVALYDMQGQQVLKSNETQRVDISTLSNGMYYYQLTINKASVQGKLHVVK